MKVERLKNIQLEAAKARQKITLPQAIKNQAKLSRAYKDLELGYEPEYDPETRSNAELQQDRLYIESQLRPRLKSLFGKDGAEIDAYVNYLQQNMVSLSDFNTIFPELQKMGSKLTANLVIARSSKLLQNLSESGTTNPSASISRLSISQLTKAITQSREIIKEQYENELMSKEDANDYTHRLNAILSVSKDTNQLKDRSEIEAVGQRIADVFNITDEEDRLEKLLDILDDSFQSPHKSLEINEKFYNRAKSSRDNETPTVTPLKTPSSSKRGRPVGSKNKPKTPNEDDNEDFPKSESKSAKRRRRKKEKQNEKQNDTSQTKLTDHF